MARPKIEDESKMSARTIARRKKERGETKPHHIHKPNEAFFSEWSPELAWVIGVIWTDGNFYRNTVEVCSKDSDLVEFIDDLTGANNIKLKNNGNHLRTYFSSLTVATFLRSIGLSQNKSFTIRWPKQLPLELEGHFMRGVIDGDGWISLRQDRVNQAAPDLNVGFCTASEGFALDVQAWLNRNDIRHAISKCSGKTLWKINVREQRSCRDLYALLYPRGTSECALIRKSSAYWYWMNHERSSPGRRKSDI